MEVFSKVVIGATIIFLLAFGWLVYDRAMSPTFSLVKSEWQCTTSHTYLRPQPTGKTVMIIQENVCDTYERVK